MSVCAATGVPDAVAGSLYTPPAAARVESKRRYGTDSLVCVLIVHGVA